MMIEVVSGVIRRCSRRRAQFIKLVAVSLMIAVIIYLGIQLRRQLIRWKLLNLANDRRLLTFHSTCNWGIGNSMFAFSSTLAVARTDTGNLPPLLCFDTHLLLRVAFPLLADWPACSPSDVLELLDAKRCRENAYAR